MFVQVQINQMDEEEMEGKAENEGVNPKWERGGYWVGKRWTELVSDQGQGKVRGNKKEVQAKIQKV